MSRTELHTPAAGTIAIFMSDDAQAWTYRHVLWLKRSDVGYGDWTWIPQVESELGAVNADVWHKDWTYSGLAHIADFEAIKRDMDGLPYAVSLLDHENQTYEMTKPVTKVQEKYDRRV